MTIERQNRHLAEAEQRWKACENLAAYTLLRLAILRDLAHGLHSEVSHSLAMSGTNITTSLQSTLTRIEQLRQAATLTGDFLKLIANPGNAGTRTRLPPDGLLNIVGREKFERHDRAWETAIASEAAAQGWSFLELTTDIPVERAETWSRDLAEKLWPNGVVLFVESASTDNVIGSNWRGRWLLAINPRLTGPEKLAAEISATSGISVLPQVRTLFRSGSMG